MLPNETEESIRLNAPQFVKSVTRAGELFLRWDALCHQWLYSRRTGYRRRARLAARKAWAEYHEFQQAELQRTQIVSMMASAFRG